MKTKTALGLNCGAFALLALLPLASRASDTTGAVKDQPGEPTTHVLFTGTDIRVLDEGKLHPVLDVDGNSLLIRVKDDAKGPGMPIAGNARRLVVNRVQTLADRSATVTNFKYERAYTAAKDPYRKASEDVLNAMAMADTARVAEAKVLAEPRKINVYRGGMKPGDAPPQIDNPFREQLENQRQMAQSMTNSSLGNVGHIAGKMAEEQALEPFDALEAEFELASETPIQAAYVVVVADYHTKDAPKDSQVWLAAKAVGAIDSSPRKVWLREGGLPPGYILENVRVDLYEHGIEIATNLSENQAALTRDEAHEYLVIEHMSAHKDDTVPARIALTKLPEDWPVRPRDEAFRKTYYIKVDKTGHPIGAFEDESCTTEVANAYYAAVLRDQLFLPALEKGNPVDSVVRMKLTRLSM